MNSLTRENTPIETYRVKGRCVFVKRDDLFAVPPAPPLAKLRGLRVLLARLHQNGVRLVGCWDTRISTLGLALAALAPEFPGLRCIVSYPSTKSGHVPTHIEAAATLGAEIHAVPGGRISLSFFRAKQYVLGQRGTMLPFGLDCWESVHAIEKVAGTVPRKVLHNGTLVLCCGSGVTLAGLLRGLPELPKRIVGLSSGRSLNNITACLRRYVSPIPRCVQLIEARMPYAESISFDCPFPTNPHYDLKAWKLLVENIRRYTDPLLFWNIGA